MDGAGGSVPALRSLTLQRVAGDICQIPFPAWGPNRLVAYGVRYVSFHLARHALSIPSYVRTAGGHVFSVGYTDQRADCVIHQTTWLLTAQRESVQYGRTKNLQQIMSKQVCNSRLYVRILIPSTAPSEREVENHGNKDQPNIAADITVETSAVDTQAVAPAPADGAVIEPYPGVSEVLMEVPAPSATPTAPQHPPVYGKTSHQSPDTPPGAFVLAVGKHTFHTTPAMPRQPDL